MGVCVKRCIACCMCVQTGAMFFVFKVTAFYCMQRQTCLSGKLHAQQVLFFFCLALMCVCNLLAPDTISTLLSGAQCLHELLCDAPLLCLKREGGPP